MQIMDENSEAGYHQDMKVLLFPALLSLLLAQSSDASACTVCHSKNPKMVRMHEALEYKDCFDYHGPASKRKAPKAKDESLTDPLCTSCHTKPAK